jgi:hypothetical protein
MILVRTHIVRRCLQEYKITQKCRQSASISQTFARIGGERPHIAGEIAGESRRLLPFRRKNAIFAANMALRAETGAPGFHPNEL